MLKARISIILIAMLLIIQGVIVIYFPDRTYYRATLTVITAACFFTFALGIRAIKTEAKLKDVEPKEKMGANKGHPQIESDK